MLREVSMSVMPHLSRRVEIDPAGKAVVEGAGEDLEIFRLRPVLGLHGRPVPTANHRGICLLKGRKKLFKSSRLLPASYCNDINLTIFTKQVTSFTVKIAAYVELSMK